MMMNTAMNSLETGAHRGAGGGTGAVNALRRRLLSLALPLWLAGCAAVAPPATVDPQVRAALAPSGSLRVGVYPGSPTSLVRDAKTGQRAGVALELGQALGERLNVPVQVVEFERLALVLDAVKAGAVDFTFTNATEVRARDVDFTQPLVRIELGYLVPAGSRFGSIAEIDRPGVRVGVAQGSSSQGVLGRTMKSATIVTAPSLQAAAQMLQQGQLDAFATNKGILFELADAVPGSRVLDGRWGLETMAIAVPKGRQVAAPFLSEFAKRAQDSGQLAGIVQRAGLRGTAPAGVVDAGAH
jgi:polar amino acid transport system substrate-binding protein